MMFRPKKLLGIAISFPALALAFTSGYSSLGKSRDYLSYEFFYRNLGSSNPFEFLRFEPGFVFSAFVAKFVFLQSFSSFVFSILSAGLLIKFWVFLRTAHPVLTILFYLANWYPLHEYTQLRLAIATSFLFLAYDQFLRGKMFWVAAICALALSFHATALFVVFLVALAHYLSKLRILYAVLLTVATGLALPQVFMALLLPLAERINPQTVGYIVNASDFGSPTIFSGSNILTGLFLIAFSFGSGFKDRSHRLIFLVTLASLCVFIGFRDIPVLAQRLKEVGLVFMTLIAFDYRITWSRLPQGCLAAGLSIWTIYSAVAEGTIGGAQG